MAGNEKGAAHPIRLSGLWHFRRKMEAVGVGRDSFSYKANKATLKVVYLIDCRPNELIIGVEGVRIYAFPVEVTTDCYVTPYLGSHYGPLLDALGVEKGTREFRTVNFFRELDGFVPDRPSVKAFPETEHIARFLDDVEEAEKVYFRGWLTHGDVRHVTVENLRKTGRLLGPAAYESCLEHNISSRWSADPRDRREITPPVTDDGTAVDETSNR